jgi:Stress responsive A/B Barrel Domain
MKYALRLLPIALISLSSCCVTARHATAKVGVEHVVLAWLKNPGNAAERAQLVAAAKSLKAKIPQVQRLVVGQPLASERTVVDDSFDVGIVMHFASQADLSTYERSPVHVAKVKAVLAPLTRQIRVHDIVSE